MRTGGKSAGALPGMTAAANLRPTRLGLDLVNALLIAPSILLVAVVLGIPVVLIVITSFQPNVLLDFAGPALDNYRYLATRAYYIDVVIRTFTRRC